MTHLRIEVVESADRLDQLRDPWTALLDRAAEDSVFLSHPWIRSWWEGFGGAPGASLYCLAAWDGPSLVGIAPLMYHRLHVLGRRRRIICSMANDYSNRISLVVDRERLDACLSAFVEHVAGRQDTWSAVRLGPMVHDSPVTSQLLSSLRQAGARWGISGSYNSPFLPLPASWDQLVDALSPSFRKTLRRKVNKGNKIQGLHVEMSVDPGRIADAMAIDQETWQHAGGSGISSTAAVRTFYTRLAERMGAEGWLRLAFVTIDRKPVCYEYNLLYKNTLYNLKLGYRPDHRDWSPGLYLKQHVLAHLVGERVQEYDFLGSEEPYKLHWTSVTRPHCYVWLIGPTWDARLAATLSLRVRPWVRDRAPWLKPLRDTLSRLTGSSARRRDIA